MDTNRRIMYGARHYTEGVCRMCQLLPYLDMEIEDAAIIELTSVPEFTEGRQVDRISLDCKSHYDGGRQGSQLMTVGSSGFFFFEAQRVEIISQHRVQSAWE